MEEIDIKICLKKINKRLKEYQKKFLRLKNKNNLIHFF